MRKDVLGRGRVLELLSWSEKPVLLEVWFFCYVCVCVSKCGSVAESVWWSEDNFLEQVSIATCWGRIPLCLLFCCIFQTSSPPASGLCYHLPAGILRLHTHGNLSSFICDVRDWIWVNMLAWTVLLPDEPSPQPPLYSPCLPRLSALLPLAILCWWTLMISRFCLNWPWG